MQKQKYISPSIEIEYFDSYADIFLASGGDNFDKDDFDVTNPPSFD